MAEEIKEDAVTDEDVEKIGAIPSTFSDSFIVTVGIDGIRLSFGERLGTKTYYRVAVQLPRADAESLAADITTMLARWDAKEKEREKEKE
jgi:hypothetical protein